MFCNALIAEQSLANDVLEHLQTQQVQVVSFLFIDITGEIRAIDVPINQAHRAMEEGLTFDGSSIPGCADIAASDMLIKPDIETIRVVPWFMGFNKLAVVICDIYKDEKTKYPGSPRSMLKKMIDEAHALGYTINIGAELEFFFLKKDDLDPMDNKGYCAAEMNAQYAIQKSSLLHLLTNFGIAIEKIHHEVASGQLELALKYADALSIADQLILTKYALQSIAQEYGYKVVFMPKPFANQNGSALHMHFSIWDSFQFTNLFYGGPNQLSTLAQQFIAGVLVHIKELTALFNTSINSYKRLVPGYEAPIYICWGTKNRSSLIRIPQTYSAQGARAELRSPDPLCNPYLAFAALLASGLEGIRKQYAPVAAIEQNLYKISAQERVALNLISLPHNLHEAIDLLEQSTIARSLMGKTLDLFVQLKRKELHAYDTHISAWELKQYI